jgi:hypothetical protein
MGANAHFVYESVEALTVVSDKAVASDLNLEGPQSPGFHERRGFKR